MEDGVSRSTRRGRTLSHSVLYGENNSHSGSRRVYSGRGTDKGGHTSGPGPFLLFTLTHTYAKS